MFTVRGKSQGASEVTEQRKEKYWDGFCRMWQTFVSVVPLKSPEGNSLDMALCVCAIVQHWGTNGHCTPFHGGLGQSEELGKLSELSCVR